MKRVLALLVIAPAMFAQVLTNTSRGVVAAHDGRVELVGGWNVAGVRHATSIVAGNAQVAVLDALDNAVVIVDLASGRVTRHETAETPIDAAFVGRELYVLCRDSQVVQKFPTLGPPASAPAVALMRATSTDVYLYSRLTGTLERLGGARVRVAPFASDFEIAGNTAYLVFPREARIRTVDLRTMKPTGEISVGAVPVDLAFAGGGTALTARVLAVADPSAKRVWLTEGTQSTAQAIARGFLRGFLGLGLFGARSSQFPTGVDRVLAQGKNWIAYDTSSGTLYRFTKNASRVLAKGITANAFTVTEDGVAYWQDGRVRIAR
ncbi:MAG TPA: hypothetical protein VJZ00_17765 [Thermoanaerobaculia bacterium]|nr:hypothetical protein [Thermoanaerobaculia bacterium]